MGSIERFKQIMSYLGYELEEQDGLKLTYRKNAKYSTLVLVIDLELKSINPILVPSSVIILQKDLDKMQDDFNVLRQDAKYVSVKSMGVLRVLN